MRVYVQPEQRPTKDDYPAYIVKALEVDGVDYHLAVKALDFASQSARERLATLPRVVMGLDEASRADLTEQHDDCNDKIDTYETAKLDLSHRAEGETVRFEYDTPANPQSVYNGIMYGIGQFATTAEVIDNALKRIEYIAV